MDELKPCPFCGGKAELKKETVWTRTEVYVKCTECWAMTKSVMADAEYCANDKAAEMWNRRAENG